MSKKTEGTPEDRCEIGKIVGVHGVRGDMLLLPLPCCAHISCKMICSMSMVCVVV